MAIKIIYTTAIEQKEEPIGKILFFDKYTPSSAIFPYFYLGEKNEIINYRNWPDLVSYLYDKKLGFFTTISGVYQYKNSFQIYSLSSLNGTLTLKFTDVDSVKAIIALDEDRKVFYLENETYNGWNKTLTPKSDIIVNNTTYLFKDTNYYINGINISNNTLATINLNVSSSSLIENLISSNIEFGLYRIQGKTALQSVYYTGIKGKAFALSDSNNLIPGLKTRSQLAGHSHSHTHTINNHTHNMPHIHDLSSHTHGMSHDHRYTDVRNADSMHVGLYAPDIFPATASWDNYDSSKTTEGINGNTSTGDSTSSNTDYATTATTSAPSNNITSDVLNKTTDIDNIYSNNNNLKIGNKTFSETYTVYAYIHGKRYFPDV